MLPRFLKGDPGAQAVCLVQRKYFDLARASIDHLRLGAPDLARRVRLVEGDITLPGLGLRADDVASLASAVTAVWHLAAVYDLSVDPDLARTVNLEGTRHVLGLAARCPSLQRFHYVSTCFVSGRHAGIFSEEDLDVGQSFHNAYEETKYRAEMEVRSALAEGLPATIYRPAIVVGDSRTGATQKFDGPYFIIRWVLRQPGTAVVPIVGDPFRTRVNLVPSDFVVDAIMHLSTLSHSVGRTYHLADPSPLTVAELLDVISEATGKRLRRVKLPAGLARWAIDGIPGVYRLTGIPSAAIDYFVHPTHYTVFQARSDLEGSGIEVPPFRSYAGTLVDFMRKHPEVGSAAMA